jgi:DNA-nicking Smr family endonuclease
MKCNGELDLHHFHPKDTIPLLEELVREAYTEGRASVRIIHGKGKSVRKHQVWRFLQDHPLVTHYEDDRFNWGATIAYLRSE